MSVFTKTDSLKFIYNLVNDSDKIALLMDKVLMQAKADSTFYRDMNGGILQYYCDRYSAMKLNVKITPPTADQCAVMVMTYAMCHEVFDMMVEEKLKKEENKIMKIYNSRENACSIILL